MSPGGDGGLSEAGIAYLEKLGHEGHAELCRKVIDSLGSFWQQNMVEREDVTNEAIYRALESKHLDPSDQPVAYIKTVARRLALKKLKKDGETVLMDNADLHGLSEARVKVDEAELCEQDQDLVARVSQGLSKITSPQQREVTGRRAQGEPAAEVAVSLLDTPSRTPHHNRTQCPPTAAIRTGGADACGCFYSGACC